MVNKLSHDQLVRIGYEFLKKRLKFPIVAMEQKCSGSREIPDVMGFRADASILIECKTSRSDFLADKNKPERRGEIEGYGNYRLYLAPKGILKLTDLPVGWGLLEVNEKNKVEITHFKQGNIYCTNTTPEHLVDDFFHTSCSKKERSMLYSILISKKKEST